MTIIFCSLSFTILDKDFAGANSLVDFVWEERRRELCFEEFHRWWDLRRTGQPMLQHELLGEVYVLQEKDRRTYSIFHWVRESLIRIWCQTSAPSETPSITKNEDDDEKYNEMFVSVESGHPGGGL